MYTRKPRRGIDGGRGGAPIWTEFMKSASTFYPPQNFNLPAGIQIWQVDPRTGSPVPDSQFGIPVALPENVYPNFSPTWEQPETAPKSDSTESG
jgi:membrane carboxypeptidase/penicillin-binding protein